MELLGSIEEAYPYIIQFYYTIFIILKRNNQHLIIDDELLKFFVYIFQNYNDKVLIHMFNIVNIIEYQKVFIDILDYNFVIEKIYYDDESLANSALAFAISACPIHLLYKDIAFEKFCHRNIVLWNVFKIFIDNGVEVSDEQELWMLKILIDLRYLEKLYMIEDIPYYLVKMKDHVIIEIINNNDWMCTIGNIIEDCSDDELLICIHLIQSLINFEDIRYILPIRQYWGDAIKEIIMNQSFEQYFVDEAEDLLAFMDE